MKVFRNCPAILDVRLTTELKESLKDQAKIERKSMSQLAREILLSYLTGKK